MSSSSVRAFTDRDKYAAALQQGRVEFMVVERGVFTAKQSELGAKKLSECRVHQHAGPVVRRRYQGGGVNQGIRRASRR